MRCHKLKVSASPFAQTPCPSLPLSSPDSLRGPTLAFRVQGKVWGLLQALIPCPLSGLSYPAGGQQGTQ